MGGASVACPDMVGQLAAKLSVCLPDGANLR